jgi:hypothetical protein
MCAKRRRSCWCVVPYDLERRVAHGFFCLGQKHEWVMNAKSCNFDLEAWASTF